MNEILKNSKTTNSLTWTKKADLKILPDVLPWHVIGPLINLELADAYTDAITKALFDRDLKVFNPSWSEEKKQENIALYGLSAITVHIHKDEFKRWWLIRGGEWPVNGLLAGWWIDEQSSVTIQTENKPNLTAIEMTLDVLEKINTTANYIDVTIGKTREAEEELKNLKAYPAGYKPHKDWMFSLWVYLGEPNPRDFHKKMEKYKGVKNSRIIEWWPAPGPHDNAVQVDNYQKPFSFHAIEKWINSSNNGTKAFKDKIDEIRNP